MSQIAIEDFLAVDIRVGTILTAEDAGKARKPAWRMTIDFGPDVGTKTSLAQLKRHYGPGDLNGRQIAAVVNFAPRQIGKYVSEVLVLGFPDETGAPVLVTPARAVPNGGRLF